MVDCLDGLSRICAFIRLWIMAHPPREENMNPIVVFLIGIVVIVFIVGGVIAWIERKKTP